MINYGEKLKDLRKKKKFTLHQMGASLGVRHSTVGSWERSTFPPLQAIVKMCDYFGIELHDFFANPEETFKYAIPEEYRTLFKEIENLEDNEKQYILGQAMDAVDFLKNKKTAI